MTVHGARLSPNQIAQYRCLWTDDTRVNHLEFLSNFLRARAIGCFPAAAAATSVERPLVAPRPEDTARQRLRNCRRLVFAPLNAVWENLGIAHRMAANGRGPDDL